MSIMTTADPAGAHGAAARMDGADASRGREDATGREGARRPAAVRSDLQRLDRALGELDRAKDLLARARAVRSDDPRTAFELVHRAALRAAGVVIDEANRHRRRRLPLNAWAALSRCGAHHRTWAEAMRPLVAERERLDRRPAGSPDPELLDAHLRMTEERIAGVRAEIVVALLPGAHAVTA